jgi:hypothetical protein
VGRLISAACPTLQTLGRFTAKATQIAGRRMRLASHHQSLPWADALLFRLLVALLPGRDLLCAKHLFGAARIVRRASGDVALGREATYPGPRAKAHHRVAGAEAGRNPSLISAACATLQTLQHPAPCSF